MAKQLWLVIEDNQYTRDTMKEYFKTSDVELYCTTEQYIETALKKNTFNIVLASFQYLKHPNLITYFKDYRLPVIVYDVTEGERVKEFEQQHVDKLMYGQINYGQMLNIAHQLIKDYEPTRQEILHFKDLELNVSTSKLMVGNKEVLINDKELLILDLLMAHPYRSFTAEKMKEMLFSENAAITIDYIQGLISTIEKKLASAHPDEKYITNIWQTGYKMVVD